MGLRWQVFLLNLNRWLSDCRKPGTTLLKPISHGAHLLSSMSSFFSSSIHLSTSCHVSYFLFLFYVFNAPIWICIYFIHLSSTTIARIYPFIYPTFLLFWHFWSFHPLSHPSVCFCILSSSTTPLSIAPQAVDERTLLVMVEQRRSPDALDRPGPFISLVLDAV